MTDSTPGAPPHRPAAAPSRCPASAPGRSPGPTAPTPSGPPAATPEWATADSDVPGFSLTDAERDAVDGLSRG